MTEFAKSLSGHDRNQIYLVVEKDERFVYLVNGTTKLLAAPKKKGRKHVQPIRKLPEEVTACLSEGLTDITIKRAVREYNRITNQNENH